MRAQSELQAGESLRWSGLTNARRAAFAAIPEAILFGGPFAGPAVLYMYYGYRAAGEMPRSSSNALSPGFGVLLFGLPFLIIGLISLLRPLWVYRAELDTVYTVTNQRVMIISGDGSRPVRSLRDIYAVQHHERRDGSGDVMIRTYGSLYTKNVDTRKIARLYGVPNVKDVARQVSALYRPPMKGFSLAQVAAILVEQLQGLRKKLFGAD
jgi:hypothetical protein